MQTISQNYRISKKAAKWLLAVMLGCLFFSSFVPKDWEALRLVAYMLMMFSGGMLCSQHAAIWDPESQSTIALQAEQAEKTKQP